MTDLRIAIGVIAAGVGFGLGWLAAGGSKPAPPATGPAEDRAEAVPGVRDAAGDVEALERALDRERELRGALELELAVIRESLATSNAASVAKPEDAAATAPEAAAETAAEPADADAASAQKEWFDEDALISRGVDERHAAWLHERFETLQMEELYLRDQAVREGWFRRPRYARQLRRLQTEARNELGDEDYDRMIFASGRNNRVLLEDVLSESPAAAAGIAGGDLLLRYDGRTVFDIHDLLAGTTTGEQGGQVAVDVLRGDEELRFYVERGPLGAKIRPQRVPPPVAR